MPNEKHQIVVVEDDDGMKQALERLLKAAGYCASTFSSAEALLAAHPPADASCCILDVHLPGLSGFELGTRLRQIGYCVPVIFITAYDDPESRKRARADWVIGYFIKPFPASALLGAIAKAVEPALAEFAIEPAHLKAPL